MSTSGLGRLSTYYLYGLLCLCAIVSILDRQALNVLVDPVKMDLGLTDFQIALVMGPAFGVVYAVFAIPIAYFSDRGSRRLVIALGLLLWGMATVTCGLAPTFAVLIIGRMLLGLGETALTPAAHTLVADMFPRHQLSRALGGLSAAANMSTGLSVTIAGGVAAYLASATLPPPFHDMSAWRLTMLIIAVPAPILAILILTTSRDPRRTIPAPATDSIDRPLAQIWFELRRQNFYLLWIFIGFGGLAAHVYSQMAWFPSFLIRVHGMSLGDVALYYGLALGAGGVVGPMIGGAVSDALYTRFGAKAPAMTLVGATSASLLQAMAPFSDSPYMAILVFGIGAVCFSAAVPLGSVIVQMTSSLAVRARVSAVWLCVFNLVGMGLGPLIVPLVANRFFGNEAALGPALVLSSTVILILCCAIFLVAMKGHRAGTGSDDAGRVEFAA